MNAGKPKVFLDTEVFLCGLLLRSRPFVELFASTDRFQLAMSDQVFSEILDVLRRSSLLRHAVPLLSSISLPDIFNAFDVEISRIPPSMTLSICGDPGDNKFLASAMFLECDFLVTEVQDLLALEANPKWSEFRESNGVKCRIISTSDFLAQLPPA